MSETIQCNLVGNAIDYLLLAGEMAQQDSPRMLKHAVATLADGLELLLKARLEAYNWCLLFKNIDDANRPKYESGDFQSVTFDQAIKRLKDICDVDAKPESLPVLNSLRKLRNRIRHFAIEAKRATAISLVTKAYGFAVDFTTENLEDHLDQEAQAYLNQLRRLLGEFDEFVSSRLDEIQPTLDGQDYATHVECPHCLQETLYPSDGESSCVFCGYRASGEEAAADWFDHHYGYLGLKEMRIMMDDMGVGLCPECGADAAIPIQSNEESGVHCLSCGETSHLRKCKLCRAATYGDFCDHCQYQMGKDD